jgi:hypothetical protein
VVEFALASEEYIPEDFLVSGNMEELDSEDEEHVLDTGRSKGE